MYLYNILINLLSSLTNMFYITNSTPQLTEHQQNRISQLKEEIENLLNNHNIDLNKIYKDLHKINKKINKKTEHVIILKFLEREIKDYNLFRSLEPDKNEITLESIERYTTLLDLKSKISILLKIKDKKDKINRIMNVN